MSLKSFVKKGIRRIIAKRPIQTSVQIVRLAPNELLKGRCALITGGTSGIGFSIAQAFINAGAEVIITGRNKEKLTLSVSELSKEGGKVKGYVLDNTRVDTFDKVFQEMIQDFGKIDILVNNAGILGAVLPNAEENTYDLVLQTNLKGPFFLSQMIGKYMKENQISGNILNIASSSSLRPAVSAYTLSKWGLRGLNMGLAKALSPYGITVNGLAPGPTATPMLKTGTDNITNDKIPLKRYIMPEEIANMAVFLVSDMGRSIIGDIVYMTGGAGVVTYEDMNYKF